MLTAVAGEIKNNAVVTDQDLSSYNGNAVIITILDDSIHTEKAGKKRNFPFDAFKDGKEYMADDFDAIPEGFDDYV